MQGQDETCPLMLRGASATQCFFFFLQMLFLILIPYRAWQSNIRHSNAKGHIYASLYMPPMSWVSQRTNLKTHSDSFGQLTNLIWQQQNVRGVWGLSLTIEDCDMFMARLVTCSVIPLCPESPLLQPEGCPDSVAHTQATCQPHTGLSKSEATDGVP